MPNPPMLEGIPELLSIREAAAAAAVHPATIRKAIISGELQAMMIAGREPKRAGRGLGYRIKRADLQAWFFGTVQKGSS